MSSLSTVEAKLPPGFRFHPRDEELICDYLMKWMSGCAHQIPFLIEVDLNKCEPWDIPETACVGGKEWYFYSQRDRKYATGLRTNRATVSGYWKATGKDRPIFHKGTLVGMRKTLVFYQGRAPKGRKTDWVMHEFRLEGSLGPGPKAISSVKEDWVLCRVFYKNRSEIVGNNNSYNKELNTIGISSTTHEDHASSASPSDHQLPPLMEPFITFDHHQTAQASYTADVDHHQYSIISNNNNNEQVPCFSIFTTNQTNPNNFSSLLTTHMDTNLPTKIMPNSFEGMLPAHHHHLGSVYNNNSNYNYNNSSLLNNSATNCSNSTTTVEDRKVIKAVLNHLTKMESGINDSINHNPTINNKGSSSSFGPEGSSDSYLSEVGLTSMWNNHY